MAMLLRSRLSSTAVPLAVRAISSLQRNGSINSITHFSTAADSTNSITRKLIRAIKSEIKCNDLALTKSRKVPATLPFTIEDEARERHITLRRAFDDEKIEVRVSPPGSKDHSHDDDEESSSDDHSDHSDGDDDSKEEEESSGVVMNPADPLFMHVLIIKENKGTLEFCTHFFPDHEIVVHRLSVTDQDNNPSPDYYMRNDLGELQCALREFLKVRGIEKTNVAGFLYNYMLQKGKKWETVRADFNNVKKFIEEW